MEKAKQLTRAEEEIMQALWSIDKGFIKDVVDAMPDPKPHYNTVSTLLKILVDKGFVTFETFGKANRYTPAIRKDAYSHSTMKQFVRKYFGGSYADLCSFFVKEKDLSVSELEQLLTQLKENAKSK